MNWFDLQKEYREEWRQLLQRHLSPEGVKEAYQWQGTSDDSRWYSMVADLPPETRCN